MTRDAPSASAPVPLDLEQLRSYHVPSYKHVYTSRDVILYALGLGFTVKDLSHVYERDPGFSTLPMYAIITAHPALQGIPMDRLIPGFTRAKALHGEQYLRLFGALPTHGQLTTTAQLIDVKPVRQGAVVVVRTQTRDATLGHLLAENEFVAFALGAGGFMPQGPPVERPDASTAANVPPSRPPDAVVTVQTHPDQAALYRLSGDLNPLHIDPVVARQVGFTSPILHGLCTLGVSVKAVVQQLLGGEFARLRSVKVRFAKHVFPGDELQVVMWVEHPPAPTSISTSAHTSSSQSSPDAAGSRKASIQGGSPLQGGGPVSLQGVSGKVVFETRVPSRDGALVISNAAVEFAATPLPAVPLPPTEQRARL